MRRLFALGAAVMLTASLAGSSLATGPTRLVNRFVGDFDMLDPATGHVVAHVVARFTEPTYAKLVPGTLDVFWAPDVTRDTFPFAELDWYPVRESHAQLGSASFGVEPGYATIAGTGGSLCDYSAPWNVGCRMFSVHLDIPLDGSPNVVWWSVPQGTADEVMFVVGPGSFVITYAGQTGT
jgi:hypothetical protein